MVSWTTVPSGATTRAEIEYGLFNIEATIRWTARALDANEGLIREMVHKRANWILKLAGLDAKLADSIVDGLRKLTADMHTDPAHPVRIKIEEALAQLANDHEILLTVESTENVQRIDQQYIHGIALTGSNEIKPGLKQYNELSEILELLEEDN